MFTAGQAFATPTSSPTVSTSETLITTTGLTAGQIKHVWVIILENKSYDATFTGLNQNSYLWKTLPSQGVLLTQYYGTGHYSQDNYLTLVSGQATQADVQSDCDKVNSPFSSNSAIITDPSDPNYGQAKSLAGQAAADGKNGCTYPDQVATLFNQLDAAGVTWKAYMQDLHNQAGREDGACGSPGSAANNPWTNPLDMSNLPAGVTSFTGAQVGDQYVAKHNPTAWFASLTGTTNADGSVTPGLTTPVQGGTDCDANHVVNLDDSATGLWQDLQSEATTPAFSWITPNNCSDAHDQICKDNNLSGAFNPDGTPNYTLVNGAPAPESTTPLNYTGGLYASDLFLKYYVQMIEQSPAFKDGGLIDITFDEANPPFTYTGNSFTNSTDSAVWPISAASGLKADAAGQNINGKNVPEEPTGWNSILKTDDSGNQLYPGPGYNAFIDRAPACTGDATKDASYCIDGIVLGAAGTPPPAQDFIVSGGPASNVLQDNLMKISVKDTGRIVTDTVDVNPDGTSPIPAGTFVGAVTAQGPLFPNTPTGAVFTTSFQLVDQTGQAVKPTGPVTTVTLSAEAPTADIANGITADPMYNATDPTPGGGVTGSVLISPLITPGTTSDTYYNHYSWLRTMEDIFQVSSVAGTTADVTLAAGTLAGGLDGLGHLGFAAQTGLMPFGTDVFSNAGNQTQPTPTPTPTPTPGPSQPDHLIPAGGTAVAVDHTGWIAAVGLVAVAAVLMVGFAYNRRQAQHR